MKRHALALLATLTAAVLAWLGIKLINAPPSRESTQVLSIATSPPYVAVPEDVGIGPGSASRITAASYVHVRSLRVVDAQNQPIAAAKIFAAAPRKSRASLGDLVAIGFTDESGLANLPVDKVAAAVELVAEKKGYCTASITNRSEIAEQSICLRPSHSLRISFVDSDRNTPIASVRVRLSRSVLPVDGQLHGGLEAVDHLSGYRGAIFQGISGVDGIVAIDNIPAGEHALSFEHEGYVGVDEAYSVVVPTSVVEIRMHQPLVYAVQSLGSEAISWRFSNDPTSEVSTTWVMRRCRVIAERIEHRFPRSIVDVVVPKADALRPAIARRFALLHVDGETTTDVVAIPLAEFERPVVESRLLSSVQDKASPSSFAIRFYQPDDAMVVAIESFVVEYLTSQGKAYIVPQDRLNGPLPYGKYRITPVPPLAVRDFNSTVHEHVEGGKETCSIKLKRRVMSLELDVADVFGQSVTGYFLRLDGVCGDGRFECAIPAPGLLARIDVPEMSTVRVRAVAFGCAKIEKSIEIAASGDSQIIKLRFEYVDG